MESEVSNINFFKKNNKRIVIMIIAIFLVILTSCIILIGRSQSITITFDSDGGSIVASQKIKKNKNVIEPKDPTKEGYTFQYWTLNNNKYNFDEPVKNNITLKAVWNVISNDDKITYTITFDTKGGSNISNQVIEDGKKISKPAVPTKEGYTFEDWYLGSTIFDFETIVDKDITLVAHWIKKENANNNTNPSTNKTEANNSQKTENKKMKFIYYSDTAKKNVFATYETNVTVKYGNKYDSYGYGTYFDNGIPSPSINPLQPGYTFREWRRYKTERFDLNVSYINGYWEELKLYPYYSYIPLNPQLTIEYVDEKTIQRTGSSEALVYQIYKVTNTNYICDNNDGSYVCNREWILFAKKNTNNTINLSDIIIWGNNQYADRSIYGDTYDNNFYEVCAVETNSIYIGVRDLYSVTLKAIEFSGQKENYDYSNATINTTIRNHVGHYASDWSNEVTPLYPHN